MLKYKYTLTKDGERGCKKDQFYLQETPMYKGYTEAIFRILHRADEPLTAREISDLTGIRSRSIYGVLTFNVYAGYIKRILL